MPPRSKVKRLSPELRAELDRLLRDDRFTQVEIAQHIRSLAETRGEEAPSRQAINRYAQRMEQVGAKLKQTREIARLWMGEIGAVPEGEVGRLLTEIVRGLAFDAASHLAEGAEPAPPKLIRELSIAIDRLQRSAQGNLDYEAKLKRQAAEELAERVEQDVGKPGGTITPERLREIIREGYGV